MSSPANKCQTLVVESVLTLQGSLLVFLGGLGGFIYLLKAELQIQRERQRKHLPLLLKWPQQHEWTRSKPGVISGYLTWVAGAQADGP